MKAGKLALLVLGTVAGIVAVGGVVWAATPADAGKPTPKKPLGVFPPKGKGTGTPTAKGKSDACKLAEKNYDNARKLGAPSVPNWDSLTCPQKIALASPGGPFLAPYVAALGILDDTGSLDKAKDVIASTGKKIGKAFGF